MVRNAILSLGLATLAACSSIHAAQMRLPPTLQGLQAEPIHGIGGGTRGSFAMGGYRGDFERSQQRLEIFNIFTKNYGHARFALAGPGIPAKIEAGCRVREKALDLDIAEFKAAPMAFRCEFNADDRVYPARLELQEVRNGLGGALSKSERRGRVMVGDTVLALRSVHALESTPLKMASPIGYVFELDGRPVGAVELNGTARMFLDPDAGGETRLAVAIAAVSLAVFWDPANSDLDRS